MATTAGYLAFAVELFAPWAEIQAKRMFGGAGLMRDGRMFGLVADDQIYLKVNTETRAAFEAHGSKPFVFVSKGGAGIAMSYWSLPPPALDDPDTLKEWADRAWGAAAKSKPPVKPRGTRSISAREIASLPLKIPGKSAKPVKKR